MRYQLRIIAGKLKGRKLTVTVDPALRPIADRVREALFSILGDAVPGQPFIDVFAGSGAVGLEALSRGAKSVLFIERDPRSANAIQQYVDSFGVADTARVLKADAYRWADKGVAPPEATTVFIGPPYVEFERHFDAVVWLVTNLQEKSFPGSVLVLQSDQTFDTAKLPDPGVWDVRTYGRTQLAFWTKPL